jgi:hypothetical protein
MMVRIAKGFRMHLMSMAPRINDPSASRASNVKSKTRREHD